MTQTTVAPYRIETPAAPINPSLAPPPEVAPAWDALRDPLWVTESLLWLTDALAHLLVTRACERYEATPLPAAMRSAPGELEPLSDREQLEYHAETMGELWQRLTRLQAHFERPVLEAPPGVRERVVASLDRPGLWPDGRGPRPPRAPQEAPESPR